MRRAASRADEIDSKGWFIVHPLEKAALNPDDVPLAHLRLHPLDSSFPAAVRAAHKGALLPAVRHSAHWELLAASNSLNKW